MDHPRPSRWQRGVSRRRGERRRILALGALVGLAIGAGTLPFLPTDMDRDLPGLVQLALLMPVGVYIAWWVLGPGLSVSAEEGVNVAATDVEVRLERIQGTFDPAAVPRARRANGQVPQLVERIRYRESIRRVGQDREPMDSFDSDRRPPASSSEGHG